VRVIVFKHFSSPLPSLLPSSYWSASSNLSKMRLNCFFPEPPWVQASGMSSVFSPGYNVIVTWLLEARIVELEETAFAKERRIKMYPRQGIHERNNRGLLETVFYMWSVLGQVEARHRKYKRLYTLMMPLRHLEYTSLCSRTIPVYTQQRNMSVACWTNSSVASLLWGHGVSVGT
jgi:hypothetical protein